MNFPSGCIVYLNLLNPANGLPFAEAMPEARSASMCGIALEIYDENGKILRIFSSCNVLFIRDLVTVGPAHADN